LADYVRNIEHNNGYRYIFVATDTYSKWLACIPLTYKKSHSIITALTELIEDLPFNICSIYSDQEAGLLSKSCRAFLESQNIVLYTTKSKVKAAQAENSIRSLRIATARYFQLTGSKRWLDYVNSYVTSYNDTPHSTTKYRPLDVVSDPALVITDKNEEPIIPRPDKASKLPPIGSLVRVSKLRANFEKESTGTYTNEVFKVVDHKVGQDLPMVRLEDLKGEEVEGNFYLEEIYPVPSNAYQYVIDSG